MTQAFLTISTSLQRCMFRWKVLDLFSFYLGCYEPFLPLCNSCTENGRYQTRRGQFCPIVPRKIENFSKQRNAKKCKEVQRSDCVQQKVLRVAKRWLCSTRGATRRRPCVHQGEGGRGIVRAGQIYLPLGLCSAGLYCASGRAGKDTSFPWTLGLGLGLGMGGF